jgi:imidazolonepropionase-like amidohydrolase
MPGFSLHDELARLVAAGLTPAEALAAATTEPASYLQADSIGRIRAGAVADLVLLDGNPLLDIANTRRIAAVVLDGRVYDRQDLDAILASARTSPQQGTEGE